MFKQIFNKDDGSVELIQTVIDENTGQEVFKYDESKYTDIAPPSNLYQPIYFRDGEWHGLTKEEYENRKPEPEPHTPSSIEIELGQTQFELFKTQRVTDELRAENEKIKEELENLKGGK